MTILVTGATGTLGRLIIDSLMSRGTPSSDITAGVRDLGKAKDLADRGVKIVLFDYDRPETLASGLKGVDRLVLVSSSEIGRRAVQHQAVIDAALQSGVHAIAYTSVHRATDSPLPLAPEHAATEAALKASGIPHVLLRNGWYIENYAPELDRARASGVLAAAAGDARVAAASRADYAEAAAIAITDDSYLGQTLELVGDHAFTYAELAAAIGDIIAQEVRYQPLEQAQLEGALRGAGLDEQTAGFVVGLDAGIAAGALDADDPTLSRLLGRPTTTLVNGLRAAVEAPSAS